MVMTRREALARLETLHDHLDNLLWYSHRDIDSRLDRQQAVELVRIQARQAARR